MDLDEGIIPKDRINELKDLVIKYPISCSCNLSLKETSLNYKWSYSKINCRRFQDPIILALEYNNKKNRIYVTTSRNHGFHYLHHIKLLKPNYLTWHEVVSPINPYRIYFDIDYYYKDNINITPELIDLTTQAVEDFITDSYDGSFNIKLTELDSTREDKFSRHLIYKIMDSNNEEVTIPHESMKNSIKSIIERIRLNINNREISLFDLNVYGGTGQNFRLIGSPKFNMANPLEITYCGLIPKNDGIKSNEMDHYISKGFGGCYINCLECNNIFLDSLITASSIRKTLPVSIIKNPKEPITHPDIDNIYIYLIENGMDPVLSRALFYKYIVIFKSIYKFYVDRVHKNLIEPFNLISRMGYGDYYDTWTNGDFTNNINLLKRIIESTYSYLSYSIETDWDELYRDIFKLCILFKEDDEYNIHESKESNGSNILNENGSSKKVFYFLRTLKYLLETKGKDINNIRLFYNKGIKKYKQKSEITNFPEEMNDDTIDTITELVSQSKSNNEIRIQKNIQTIKKEIDRDNILMKKEIDFKLIMSTIKGNNFMIDPIEHSNLIIENYNKRLNKLIERLKSLSIHH